MMDCDWYDSSEPYIPRRLQRGTCFLLLGLHKKEHTAIVPSQLPMLPQYKLSTCCFSMTSVTEVNRISSKVCTVLYSHS